jgi:hypothetical protein
MYVNSEVTCANSSETPFLQHAVTLRLYCDSALPIFYYTADAYLECADDLYSFKMTIDLFGNEGIRYMCSTSASFPAGSSPKSTQTIPDVAIVTDDYWLRNPDKRCYTNINNNPSPTSVPVTTVFAPLKNSTVTPVSKQIMSPAPFTLPSSTNPSPFITSPIAVRETPDDKTPLIYAIAGGIAGGCLLVIGLCIYAKRTKAKAVHALGVEDHAPPPSSNVPRNLILSSVNYIVVDDGGNQRRALVHFLPMDDPGAVATSTVAAPSLPYVADYKDQCRTVLGGRPQILAVDGPIQMYLPVAMGTKIIAESKESPGRRIEI